MASQHLIGLALEQLVPGAMSVARLSNSGDDDLDILAPALKFLQSRFTDQSARLVRAIERATERAWRALELVLAGDSLWDRLKGALAAQDMKAFRHDVRGLLAAAGVDGAYPVDRRAAAQELRAARKANLLQPTGLTPAGMLQSVGVFGRFDDPAELAAGQWRAATTVAAELKSQGYPALAAVIAFRPGDGALPLLGVAIRYFFRRAVEADAVLARGLTFARLEGLAETQKNRFESLDRLITEQAEQLDRALGELAAEVAEVKAVALDIRAEQDRLGDQNRQIMEAVLEMQAKLDQVGRAAVRPRDSVSIHTDAERELVKKVLAQYRGLPEATRKARPALRNAVGMLEVAAGDFVAARSDFAAVAAAVADPVAKGAAHMNAYRAALEARDWDGALQELLAAAKCDSRRYATFPMGKYLPQRILGAGGFGVAVLCKHKYMDARVVVKTLLGDGADYDAVFAEARAAAGVQHPGIVRVTDCGYVEPKDKDRPFVVMDYFPGKSLQEYVAEEGAMSANDLVPLGRALAESLGKAHEKGILHRDVKPGNILVRRGEDGLEARVIDFGLAVRRRPPGAETSASASAKTLVGDSIAGTVAYAAPEQLGRLPGVRIGPYSDVFGWGKTCCFALFQTAQPTLRHWQGIPHGLADLLGRCLEEDPTRRPQSFDEVIEELDELGQVAAPARERRGAAARDDDRPATREPQRDDRPGRPRRNRDRQKSGSFPVLPIVVVAITVVFTLVLVIVLTNQRKGPDAGRPVVQLPGGPVATVPGPSTRPSSFPSPVGGGTVGPGVSNAAKPAPKSGWPWPGAPPTPRPELPAGYRQTSPQGGAAGRIEFRDFRQDGSMLVGFHIGLGKRLSNDMIVYLRPIWRTPTGGEELGPAYGRAPPKVWEVKAKEGYAVGGMITAGGIGLDGICFTFMRISGKSLDPDDSYLSDWFGEQRRKPPEPVLRVGDGSPIVGIHGMRYEDRGGNSYNDGGGVVTIGVILAPKE
jgi:hypothetical protein